jgi:integrase
MARKIQDTALDTRAARLRLAVRGEPYWRSLDGRLALGYRRNKKHGAWIARRWDGETERSHEEAIGKADDILDADGQTVFSFSQAQERARAWWVKAERIAQGFEEKRASYTIADAASDYMLAFNAKGKKSGYSTQKTIDVHILTSLGAIEINRLRKTQITRWRDQLASSDKMVRTKRIAAKQATKAVDRGDADAMRARRSTANRILTVLKAILNHAWHEGVISTDAEWRSVKPFENVDAPLIRYLTRDEAKRLCNTCEPDLRRLVRGGLLTGARYGELIRMRARDYNRDVQTVTIPEAKGGKARHVVLNDEGVALFDELTAGRSGGDLIFTHDDGSTWKASQQTRPIAEACQRASIEPAIGFHVLRHTHASLLAMAGAPLAVVATQLGHADTRITEHHYAHLAPSYVADTIRATMPKFGIGDSVPVARIDRRAR